MTDQAMWDFFWEVRLQKMEGLGKREAILTASRLIRAAGGGRPLRLFEPGCGEAQIIGALVEGHSQECSRTESVGIDYLHSSIERCRKDYPGMRFIEGDFTDPALVDGLGQFDMLLLVNALHEVFSLTFSEDLGEVDVPRAKERVAQAFALSVAHVRPGGYIVLFDGLETPGDITRTLNVRFLTRQAREHFDIFVRDYHPFQIRPRLTRDPFVVELSWRDFTRYLTKSIFLGKHLWPHEKFESYQYYNEDEFRAMFARENVEIIELRKLTENYEKWAEVVEIEEDFPVEHIIIVGKKGHR
ncbi:MAG: class I SAM-dependent methyltransferase [Anaerolineaceae bacterium]|nr:class I SAM-dependent methyltransferase [Anaerolineaceae bacterium]